MFFPLLLNVGFAHVKTIVPQPVSYTHLVARLFGEEAVGAADYLAGVALEYAEMPALANGSYGESVSRLQQALKALGYFEGSSDGAYGEATEAAVSRFQLANGLKETGIADSAVFLRIYAGTPVSWTDFLQDSCASVGDSGSNVRMLQVWLTRKGYFLSLIHI